jgi:hypothetical protein
MSRDDHPIKPDWEELVQQCKELVERIEDRPDEPAGTPEAADTPEAAFDRLRAEYRQADGSRSPPPRPAGRVGWLGRLFTHFVPRRTNPRS